VEERGVVAGCCKAACDEVYYVAVFGVDLLRCQKMLNFLIALKINLV
jgi:hypothetical protein